MENSLKVDLAKKSGFKFCAIFYKNGVDEMMKNANCLEITYLVNDYLHFFKEASKSNPLLV